MREPTLLTVFHPDYLEAGALQLVRHPTTSVLWDGEPTLGWEGDPRLAIYLHLKSQRFVLYRLEHDGEYRGVAVLPPGAEITPANMNSLISRLQLHDTRRGADPHLIVASHVAQADRDRARLNTDRIEDWADKFHFALARSHLRGVNISRPRMLPTKPTKR